MRTYTIGQVAERTGFSASALRYYEGIGLVAPASRNEAGYRIYNDQTMGRLAFIARAKQLGCSLEEITDLVSIWDGDRCGPVQGRFHALVTDKIHDARSQIAELGAFGRQLEEAAAALSAEPVDGPCGSDCACVREATPGADVRVDLIAKASGPPIACILDASAMPDRLAHWNAIFCHVRSRTTTPAGALRIEFDSVLDLADLARLVAAEQHCCAFFSFAVTVDARGVGLEVGAPNGAEEMVASLFGQPA